jgi:hypothetical protein
MSWPFYLWQGPLLVALAAWAVLGASSWLNRRES